MWLNLIRRASTAASAEKFGKTCLYNYHLRHGGKMVEFAGFTMPVQYGDVGIAASHGHTRSALSIFDVSHMLQTEIQGKDSIEFMESITVGNIAGLPDNMGTLSLFTNESGGIVDDLICNKIRNDFLYVVSNAGRRTEDQALLSAALEVFQDRGKDVHARFVQDRGLLAVQGPKMMQVMQPLIEGLNLSELTFMRGRKVTVAGIAGCRVTRCGYTGEDGVEISVPSEKAEHLADVILGAGGELVALAG